MKMLIVFTLNNIYIVYIIGPLLWWWFGRSGPSRSSFDLSYADELSKSETAAVLRLIVIYIYSNQG